MHASRYAMMPMAEALECIAQTSIFISRDFILEQIPISVAGGRVFGEDILSPCHVPAFRASVMDGYAIRGLNLKEFKVSGHGVLAGDQDSRELEYGEAMYVTTGAAVPDGAELVVKVEDTEVRDNIVVVKGDIGGIGRFIRDVGSDIELGQIVLQKGNRMQSADIGLLAMVGVRFVKVHRKVRVGILSTGSELVSIQDQAELQKGKVYDSNSIMLKYALEELGAHVLDFGIVQDDAKLLDEKMEEIIPQVDILVTSGGVSMGVADLVKPFLERRGKVFFGRLLMKPGKPSTFAVIENASDGAQKMVFGLPGNPVSCLVCLHLLVRPALSILQGLTDYNLTRFKVVLGQDIKMDPERPEYSFF
jgi:gephyrin